MATLSPSPSSPLAGPPTSTDTPPPPPEPSTPAPLSPTKTDSDPPESSTDPSPPPPDSSTLAPQPPAQPDSNPPESSTVPSPPPPDNSPPPAPPPPLESTSPPPGPPVNSPPPPIISSPPPDTSPPPPPTVAPPPSPLYSPPPVTPSPNSPPPPATDVPPVPSPPSNPPSPPPPLATKSPPPPSPSHATHRSPPPPPSKSDPPVSPETNPPPPPRSPSPPHRPPSSPQSPESAPSPPAREPSTSPPKNSASSPLTQISPPPLSPSPVLSALSPADRVGANSTASPPSKGGMSTGGTVAVGVAVGLLMLGLIGLMAFYINKRKRRTSIHNGGYIVPSPFGSSPRSDFNLIVKTEGSTPFFKSDSGSGTLSPHSHGGLGQSRSWFTYQELFEATKGFAQDNLLGEGGFGCVYKGILVNEKEVAVKQLKIGASQGEREFKAEVEIISRIHHRHLVSLVGYCIYESKRLLVYEYVPNQTLYYHLHGENRPVMDWATRIKIAEGSARGIAYLHEDCHPRIIHRDIKSSNILLDNKFEARVADFGLAKLALDVDTHVSTRVMGTFGYMAPEYATSGKLTEKSDVYSFGVVLLELLTGRKPVDASQPLGDESLVEWARPLLSHTLDTGKLEGLVDPRLEKNYVESELFLMIEAAAACVRHSATKRPRMGQIVRAFDRLSPSDLSNGMRVGHSEIYDSAQQSAEIRWFRRMAFGSQDYSTEYFSEAARNPGHVNPKQNNQGPVFTTQSSQNDPSGPSQQQSQNIYFSSHRTQGPVYSGQSSLNVGSSNRQPEQFMDRQWTL